MDDVEKIAASLTKGQQQALVRAESDGNLGRYFARFMSMPTRCGLIKKGLGTSVWSGVMLSECGLAVRAHLLANAPR